MSSALSGEHYCAKHQGNHSYYADENCTVCKLQAQVNSVVEAIRFYNAVEKASPEERMAVGTDAIDQLLAACRALEVSGDDI